MTAAPPWRLQHFESLGSTSDLCISLAQAGEPARLAVLATRQVAARGSRGRAWVSLPGNLALSVLLRPPGPPRQASQWALLAAVALAEALEQFTPGGIVLKWPNDVMLDGGKLGGILLDSAVGEGRLDWLVIGFGANLASAPDLPDRVAAQLPGAAPAPRAVALAVLDRLDHWSRAALLDGFGAVRHAWIMRGPAPGALLRLRLDGAEISGAFAGLGDDGALLLQTGGRVRALQTGEVLQANRG